MFEKLFEQLINDEELIKVGDRVIVRSNEDDPLMFGEYVGEQEIGTNSLPLVKSEKDGKTYMVGGIMKKFSNSLLKELGELSPKEQWNFLSNHYKRM